MTLEEIVKELEFKYPQLKRAFGTINTFLDNLVTVYSQQAASYVTELLNFKGKLIVIDPVQLRFTLYDNYDDLDLESIIFEEPYQIYNFDKELLYSVSSHFGVFGNSILDGLLNIDFKPSSLFYLNYSTYNSKQQIVLVTGLLPITANKKIGLTSYKPSTLVKGNSLNQISIKLTSGQRDMTKPGLPYYPIKVYQLATPSPVLLSRLSVTNSSLTQKVEYNLESGNQILITPNQSSWLAFSQVTKTGEVPLTLSNFIGAGVDRLIEAAPNLYYLALDSDININLLKKAFNLDNVSLPNFDNYTGLDIKAELSE